MSDPAGEPDLQHAFSRSVDSTALLLAKLSSCLLAWPAFLRVICPDRSGFLCQHKPKPCPPQPGSWALSNMFGCRILASGRTSSSDSRCYPCPGRAAACPPSPTRPCTSFNTTMLKRWGPPHGRTAAVDRLTVRHFVLPGGRCSLLRVPSPHSFAPSPGAVSPRSVAIASKLEHNKLRRSLPCHPATYRRQCRSRKVDSAAFSSEHGRDRSRTRNTLATSPRWSPRVLRTVNPCMNRTQPPVLPFIPLRTAVHRAGLSYTIKATTPLSREPPQPGLKAASHPASQTRTIRFELLFSETLAPAHALDGLLASLLATT